MWFPNIEKALDCPAEQPKFRSRATEVSIQKDNLGYSAHLYDIDSADPDYFGLLLSSEVKKSVILALQNLDDTIKIFNDTVDRKEA